MSWIQCLPAWANIATDAIFYCFGAAVASLYWVTRQHKTATSEPDEKVTE